MLVKAKPTNNCNTRNSNNLEVYEEKDFTCSELLDFIGKCRGEHHRDPLPLVRHVPTADNIADGFVETHVQESISFVEDQKPDLIKGDFATSQEILYTTWRADQFVSPYRFHCLWRHL